MGTTARTTRVVFAAGAVVVRGHGATAEVLMVRPDDADAWRLPVDAVGPNEYPAVSAARAVAAQTGLHIRMGVPLDRLQLPEGDRRVAWWRGSATAAADAVRGSRIAGVAWMPAGEAAASAGGEHERAIRLGLTTDDTLPVLVVRHGKAMQRSNWNGRDQARPLDERGRRQAQALIPLLAAYGVSRLASSTSTRCVKTLLPYATSEQLEIEGWATLSEEQAEDHPKAVGRLVRRLVDQSLGAGMPMALCGHRPVLPAMLSSLDIPAQPLQPGAVMVAHLSPAGKTLATEHHRPRL